MSRSSEHHFDDEGLGRAEPRSRQGGPEVGDVAEGGAQQQRGQQRTQQLRENVAGHPAPPEVVAQRERDADDGVQVCPRHRTHEQVDRQHSQGRSGDFGDSPNLAGGSVLDHGGAGSDQQQQERAEQSAEQPPPLVAEVGEVTARAQPTRHQSIGAWGVCAHHRLNGVSLGLKTVVVMAYGLRHGCGGCSRFHTMVPSSVRSRQGISVSLLRW